MGNGGNFDVPQEVMAVLPADPYEQLDLARRITAMALAERLSKLEAETGKLRAKLAEKDLVISELQDRVMDAESSLQETTSRLSSVLDEHSKLTNEKNLLTNQVKKLNRDVAKLETFKRTLMQSLQDDGDDHKAGFAAASAGGDSYSHSSSFSTVLAASNAAASSESKKYNNGSDSWQSSSRASVVEQEEQSDTTPVSQDSNEVKHVEIDTAKPQPQMNHTSLPSPQPTVQQQPASAVSAAAPVESSRWQSAGSPESAPVAETRPPPVESKLTIPLSLPSSRSTTAPNSPPNVNSTPGRTPRVDGKEFFRQARNRLSYEQFSSFLANIKELNAHRQTREETLRKADKTFGPENKDLYIAFDGLLSRHLST
ncbi:unnamed protein product [Calypogeia fissa]